MIFLIVSIFVSCGTSVIFRYSEGLGHDGDNIMLVNYIMSTALSFLSALASGNVRDFLRIKDANFLNLFGETTVESSVALLTVLGLFSGVYYMSSLVVMRRSYLSNGVGITLMFSKSCFVMPFVMSFLLWREMPQGLQLLGAALSVVALVIVFMGSGKGSSIKSASDLIVAFLICGFMQINSKLFTNYCFQDLHQGLFLTVLYGTAALMALGLVVWSCKKKGKRFFITAKEWGFGLVAGCFNFGFNFLELKSLETLPAGLVFPCVAAGGLVVGALSGHIFFKERLGQRQKAAMVVTVVGLALANL